jgi:hypothetical protein
MKQSIIKASIGLLFIAVLPKLSLAKDGKPFNHISLKNSLSHAIQDTIPPVQTVVTIEDTKKEKKIKVLPKPRRQPVPVPVNVKIKPVIKPIIKPVIKPVIKILH